MNFKDPDYLNELEKCGLAKVHLPLFKFLIQVYAIGLVTEGSVRVSRLADFREPGKFANQIYDPEEGRYSIVNRYDHYSGLPEEAYGTLQQCFPHGEPVNVVSSAFEIRYDFGESLAYCTTTGLFNGSMIQAFEDEKEECVMIFDPEAFFEIITPHLSDFIYQGYDECRYIGRKIEEQNPFSSSYSNLVLKRPAQGILHKEPEFKNQAETRAVWTPLYSTPSASINLKDQKLTAFVKPLHFTGIDLASLKAGTQKQVVIQLKHKLREDIWISFEEPKEIPTPIILFLKHDPKTPYLAFIFLSHQKGPLYVYKPYNNHTEIFNWDTPFCRAFYLNRLENIEEIFYHTVQEGIEISKKNPVVSLGLLTFHSSGIKYVIDLTCIYTREYPRWYGFLQMSGNEDAVFIILSNQSGVWKAEEKSEIQDGVLLEALGKEVEKYYSSKNVSFPI